MTTLRSQEFLYEQFKIDSSLFNFRNMIQGILMQQKTLPVSFRGH